MTPTCPVCRSDRTLAFIQVDGLDYWRCPRCLATFLDPAQRPDRKKEKAEYDRHQNLPDDPGYRRFLSRLADPLLERLAPGSAGLDFGCGPGPALALMLVEAGHRMQLYDPFFHPDRTALERRYDFITCTEVVEHLHDPAAVFELLDGCLRPGGWLGIMTRFQTDDSRFANWHYRRDPTHVVFYRPETFAWLGQRWGWEIEVMAPDRILARVGASRMAGAPD